MLQELSYFKSVKGRNVKDEVIQYHCLRNDGTIKTVDITRKIIKHNLTFGSIPLTLEISTKEEFEKAFHQVKTA